jgi:hypothetical protein
MMAAGIIPSFPRRRESSDLNGSAERTKSGLGFVPRCGVFVLLGSRLRGNDDELERFGWFMLKPAMGGFAGANSFARLICYVRMNSHLQVTS